MNLYGLNRLGYVSFTKDVFMMAAWSHLKSANIYCLKALAAKLSWAGVLALRGLRVALVYVWSSSRTFTAIYLQYKFLVTGSNMITL
tara:strand:- start:196 stop:456 length:261 start_codon:yes stop_codon:yes gene_type:complete